MCLIFRCHQQVAEGREDYRKLRDELESLFWQLIGYLGGPTPPPMTSSLVNLAQYVLTLRDKRCALICEYRGIEREIGFVLGKEKRNRIERGAEAMEDADEVLECYRRVQRLLERFPVSVH